MQHDHVLKKLKFDHLTPPPVSGGGGGVINCPFCKKLLSFDGVRGHFSNFLAQTFALIGQIEFALRCGVRFLKI